ncbi:hypothetical protein J6590_033124 [Homalodisca vitripennis]|nr:hypothetical protein J6590_033124 [Homalodisca vitripennis]
MVRYFRVPDRLMARWSGTWHERGCQSVLIRSVTLLWDRAPHSCMAQNGLTLPSKPQVYTLGQFTLGQSHVYTIVVRYPLSDRVNTEALALITSASACLSNAIVKRPLKNINAQLNTTVRGEPQTGRLSNASRASVATDRAQLWCGGANNQSVPSSALYSPYRNPTTVVTWDGLKDPRSHSLAPSSVVYLYAPPK